MCIHAKSTVNFRNVLSLYCIQHGQCHMSANGLELVASYPHPSQKTVKMVVSTGAQRSHTMSHFLQEKWSVPPFSAHKRENGDIVARGSQVSVIRRGRVLQESSYSLA